MLRPTFKQIFGQVCPFTLEEIKQKFAFDVRLPEAVKDTTTGEPTWASSINPKHFITQNNMRKYSEDNTWMRPKTPLTGIKDVIEAWQKINYMTTERQFDSLNVSESDTIYSSENVFRSLDCTDCKNVVFSEGCVTSENIIACQRSSDCHYALKVDDSATCINCYQVIASSKISQSYFIQDAKNLRECMFCSHISNRKYCIANMQCEEKEYFFIKQQIIKWILKGN